MLQRICQYLIADPLELHKWISGGILHVMSLRATCQYLNHIVKEGCLRFEFSHEIRTTDHFCMEMKGKFLTLAHSEFNWKCTAFEFELRGMVFDATVPYKID